MSTASMPSAKLEMHIILSMARTLFVCAWADAIEEAGRARSGGDFMADAPATPEEALKAAKKLAALFRKENGVDMAELLKRATEADPYDFDFEDPDEDDLEYLRTFGHYMAMSALGHGVCWDDDHATFEVKEPHFEYYLDYELDHYGMSGQRAAEIAEPWSACDRSPNATICFSHSGFIREDLIQEIDENIATTKKWLAEGEFGATEEDVDNLEALKKYVQRRIDLGETAAIKGWR